MSNSVRESIYEALASIRLIDPHTHINPHHPASSTLADLLGYHYYTELAHSAGMPKDQIEQPGLDPRELVGRLVNNLGPLENTAQYRWLVEICRMFFGFDGDRIDGSNWESLYDLAEQRMNSAQWPQMVLDQSNVEAVFLTNDFDDALSGFDTDVYIPCLRTDDLVFHLGKAATQQRLAACSGIELDGSLGTLRAALEQRFDHFVRHGARACAISLPPHFEPAMVSEGRAATALQEVLRKGPQADPAHQSVLSRRIFWTLAELCDQYGLPFDLMIGVNRGVYAGGVYQGQDLYDSRVSLIQYGPLFNAFPNVKFPVSVLASVTNQELVSYAWIFPNVITNGHWWYSNTPSFIARDAAARLEAVPQTKQIAYYSDAYKLEFVWPKFDMYRRVLAGILADHFVVGNGWTEQRAVELGRRVLRDNVDELFPRPAMPASPPQTPPAIPAGGETNNDFSTIFPVPPSGAEKSTDETEESFDTVIDFNADKTPHQESFALPSAEATESDDRPTMVNNDDTIRIDDELDPLPTLDEVQAVEVADVELDDFGAERARESESIGDQLDDEPLDVGDLFGDESSTDAATTPEIQPLRGEDSFELDEDSLRVQPDPTTGEWTFPTEESEQTAAESADLNDEDDLVLDLSDTGSEDVEEIEFTTDEIDFSPSEDDEQSRKE